MPKLFDDDVSEEDVNINTNTEYANKYNQWRKKEELYHLEQKYKSKLNSESDADSSSSDEELENIEESLEKSFFKTLSCLKNKDPKIYDENVVFFEENESEGEEKVEKKPKKSKPLTIPEYERQLLLKQSNFSDEDEKEINPRAASPTYAEEQRRLQESLKKVVKEDDDGEEGWGGLFVKREKTKEEQEQEEADYRKWLKGQKDKLDDDADASELKSLRDYWNNPDLNESEAYLRDYLLNRRYLEKEDENRIPTYEEIVHDSDEGLSEDEKAIERQEEFEIKYNFRYEEPDQEFIKRYPRTMEHSVRKTDDRRKIKRVETKERKLEKKKEREEELKQLKMLKLNEIQERINKLKQITGNEEMAFQDNDIDGDFDPEAHDRRMQELFNDDYYGVGDEEKPEFPDLEEELGPWKDKNELSYDDENFNMDCDYDPSTSKKSKKEKKKRNRPGKTPKKVDEEALENDENFKEFEDEYYNLDFEDMIGDIPCRFKYRKVVPNSFGLTVEEILLAKEQELNRWCSLKKVVQIRPEHIEKYDVFAYQKKARNEDLKKKILPSLYADLQEEKIDDTEENGGDISQSTPKNKNETLENNAEENNFEHTKDEKSKKKQSKKKLNEHKGTEEEITNTSNIEENNLEVSQVESPKKKSKKRKNSETLNKEEKSIDDTPKKKKKHENDTKEKKELTELTNEKDNVEQKSGKKKKKKKNLNKNSSVGNKQNISNTPQSSPEKTNLSKENTQSNKEINTISRRQKKNERKKLKKLNTSTEKSKTIQNEQKDKNDTKSNTKNKKKLKKKQHLNNTDTSSGNDSNFGKNRKRKFSAQNTDSGQRNIPNKKKKFDKNQPVKGVKFSDARLEAYGINPKKFKNKLKYKQNL